MAQVGRKATFEAGNVRFAVQHELWDGNIDDHSDQAATAKRHPHPAARNRRGGAGGDPIVK